MPNVIKWLLEQEATIDGFLAPGHVCAITGSGYFAPLASRYKVPMAVSGFKDKELLVAIYGLVKMVAIVACEDAHRALDIIRKSKYGQDARIIGSVAEQLEGGKLILKTAIGGRRNIEVLQGEGLPRIC